MLEQWRAGLRVSEALDLEVRDLSLDAAYPTLRVRASKGGKSRLVPVHPELHAALTSALSYGSINQGRIVEAHPAQLGAGCRRPSGALRSWAHCRKANVSELIHSDTATHDITW